MANVTFQAGVFNAYRATNKIHLGQIALDLPEGEVVQYDGTTMKWGGKEHTVPALGAAIKAGWLVDATDKESKYVPKPAGVVVHSASNAKQEIVLEPTFVDETLAGTLADSQAKRKEAMDKSLEKDFGASSVEGINNIGVQVGASKPMNLESAPVTVGSNVGSVSVDMTVKPTMKKNVDLTVEQEPVVVRKLGSPTGKKETIEVTENEGVTIGKIKTAASQKTVITDSASVNSRIRQLDSLTSPQTEKIPVVKEEPDGEVIAQVAPEVAPVIQAGEFVWDMKPHWKKRVQLATEKYGKDPEALEKIYAKELPNVTKHIKAALEKK
jgi:hypothetical protein